MRVPDMFWAPSFCLNLYHMRLFSACDCNDKMYFVSALI